MHDDNIIGQVDSWARERIQLQHRRRRLAILIAGAAIFLVGLAYVGPKTIQKAHDLRIERSREASERAAKDADRHLRYEHSWSRCTESIGPEACNDIESRLAERCLGVEGHDSSSVEKCLQIEIVP